MAAKKGKNIKQPDEAPKGQVQAKAKPKAAAKPAAKKASIGGPAQWWATSVQFLREVVNELKKVTWPSRQQVVSSTAVVLVLVIIVSAYLGLVDWILANLVKWALG